MLAYILGVDPGTTAGAGLVKLDGQSITLLDAWQHVGRKDTPEWFAWLTTREASLLAARDYPHSDRERVPIYLCHEAQYQGVHTDSAFAAAVNAGAWRGAASPRGYRVIDWKRGRGVHPQTWRAALDDRPKGQRKARTGPQWERWAVEYVRGLGHECKVTHHHKAEGCLIAIWGAMQLRDGGRALVYEL
jgi:hypothetical protein